MEIVYIIVGEGEAEPRRVGKKLPLELNSVVWLLVGLCSGNM